MFYLSSFLGTKVLDRKGAFVGSIADMVIKAHSPSGAVVKAVVSRGKKGDGLAVLWQHVIACDEAVILSVDREALPVYIPDEDDILLRDNILDKQIIDIKGIRVVRVNDVALARHENSLRVAGVDTGWRGALRRLGLLRPLNLIGRAVGWTVPERLVPWNCVEPLAGALSPITLTVPWQKVRNLHPADLADIVDDLDANERRSLFNALDDEVAAHTLAELEEPKIQESILDTLGEERASDLLEEMPPDDAADILGDLPPHKARSLLEAMEDDEAAEVESLLHYDEDTAGGLMTTDLGFEGSLEVKSGESSTFYWFYTAMVAVGAATVVMPNIDFMKIMLFSQTVNGVLLPLILYFMLKIINNREIMGNHTNSRLENIIAAGQAIVLVVLTAVMVAQTFIH